MTIRVMRSIALALAALGLVLLWWFAAHSPVPTLKIGQAQATTNLAYVRVQGQVTRAPSLDPDRNTLSFWIADDTGELLVSSYRSTTEELIGRDQAPGVGDHVTAEGTLRVRPDSASLTLNSADALRVERAQPVSMDVGEIDPTCALRAVTIRGQVRAVRSPYKGLTLITLRDRTGKIDVAVPEVVTQLYGPVVALQPGQSAEATGVATLYKDAPQITLTRADALCASIDSIPVASPAHLADLETRAGQWAAVHGTVVKVNPFSAGVKLTLDDGTGRADVVLWRDLYGVLSSTLQLAEGAQVAVQGEVSLYRGAVEITPELFTDVSLAAAPPTVRPTSTLAPTRGVIFTPMSQLTPGDKGEFVSVRGKIVAVIPFSKGVKYQLNDTTGQVVLLLWQDVFDQLPDAAGLARNAQVSVTGTIDVFDGEIEVIPKSAADVQVMP
jgi:DNA/RNA endonuclease YhcR with UshA esterase domain